MRSVASVGLAAKASSRIACISHVSDGLIEFVVAVRLELDHCEGLADRALERRGMRASSANSMLRSSSFFKEVGLANGRK